MLGPDQPETGQALGALLSLAATINRYAGGLVNATFAPANIFGHSVDLLANLPEVRANLTVVQTHALSGQFLCVKILMGLDAVSQFSDMFRNVGDTILTLLADAQQNQNGLLSVAQTDAMHAGLQSLCDLLTTQREKVTDQQSGMRAFYDLITADHAALYTGEQTIHTAIDRIRSDGLQDALKALQGFGSEGIIALIGQETTALVTTLNGYDLTFQMMLQNNQTAQTVMSNALAAWKTVEVKYTSLLNDLKASDRSSKALIELLDIKTAEIAWNQLVAYCQQVIMAGLRPQT
ncbi:MAG: hypothetical protein ABIP75_16395 [Pyrinomonadaceae bacterium]